jgi:L-threonylcarbamoyladenylate synthase
MRIRWLRSRIEVGVRVGTSVEEAVTALRKGLLVAIPTETVYGLAANAFSVEAVARIFEAKQRPQFNPLIIHSNSIERFESWGITIPQQVHLLANKFSPGPLTYLVPKSELIPDLVTAGSTLVAIRIPDHPLTLKLLSQLDFPVAAPSANLSGSVSPTTARHVEEQLGDKVAYILDGGPCAVGVESTIISFAGARTKILRYGGLAVEQIEAVTGKVDLPSTGDKIEAPGMLLKHYGIRHRLEICDPAQRLNSVDTDRTGIIAFKNAIAGIPLLHQRILSPRGDLREAASNLFQSLRELSQLDIDFVLAEKFPEEGLGRAINDRLGRAAAE